jgi:hypothetical protein
MAGDENWVDIGSPDEFFRAATQTHQGSEPRACNTSQGWEIRRGFKYVQLRRRSAWRGPALWRLYRLPWHNSLLVGYDLIKDRLGGAMRRFRCRYDAGNTLKLRSQQRSHMVDECPHDALASWPGMKDEADRNGCRLELREQRFEAFIGELIGNLIGEQAAYTVAAHRRVARGSSAVERESTPDWKGPEMVSRSPA